MVITNKFVKQFKFYLTKANFENFKLFIYKNFFQCINQAN